MEPAPLKTVLEITVCVVSGMSLMQPRTGPGGSAALTDLLQELLLPLYKCATRFVGCRVGVGMRGGGAAVGGCGLERCWALRDTRRAGSLAHRTALSCSLSRHRIKGSIPQSDPPQPALSMLQPALSRCVTEVLRRHQAAAPQAAAAVVAAWPTSADAASTKARLQRRRKPHPTNPLTMRPRSLILSIQEARSQIPHERLQNPAPVTSTSTERTTHNASPYHTSQAVVLLDDLEEIIAAAGPVFGPDALAAALPALLVRNIRSGTLFTTRVRGVCADSARTSHVFL